MLAFAILDAVARALVRVLPKVWRDRINYNASDLTVFVVETQKTKTKPRMTMVEAVFATMLFDLALFGTDNVFINFVIRAFTKFQNSWDKPFQSPEEATKEVTDFCERLQIQQDPWQWEKPIAEYKCLNDFFSRRYSNPPAMGNNDIVSPACSTITVHSNNEEFTRLVVKGCDYALEEVGLYPPKDLAAYAKHHVFLGYLSPKDYHRFHAPMSGKCIHCAMEDAKVDSASVKFFGGRFNILNKNKRLIVVLEDKTGRRVAMVIIGGIGVNTIEYNTRILNQWVEKGTDLGTFRAGGSAFCLLSNHPLTLNSKLLQSRSSTGGNDSSSDLPMEVLFGEPLANFSS
jgi:phosphatidylserine decarboxylase precursor